MLAAALVFGVTMTGITVYELVSGDSFSGGKGTTVSAAVTGHDTSSSPKSGDHTPSPADSPSGSPNDSSPSRSRRPARPTPAHLPRAVLRQPVRPRHFGRRRYADPHTERVGYRPSTLRK